MTPAPAREPADRATVITLGVAAVFAAGVAFAVAFITSFTHRELPPWGLLGGIAVVLALVAAFRLVFDSRVIMQFINRETKNALFPRNAIKRLDAERREALADGISDCLLAAVYERRYRPAEIVHEPWIERQRAKAFRGLDALCAGRLTVPARIDGGHIAMRAMIGYLELRFAGQWEKGRSKLKRYAAKFDERFPELAALVPRA